jgi:capsular exopolysaccharide synthesis family protein
MSSKLPTRTDPKHPAEYTGGGMPEYASGAPSGPPDPGLMRYVNAVLRYKWIILLLGVVGAGVGVALSQFVTPMYQATGRIFTEPGLAGGNPTGPIRAGPLLVSSSWVEVVRSDLVVDTVVMQERLYVNPANATDWPLFDGFRVNRARLIPHTYRLDIDQPGQTITLYDGSGAPVSSARFGEPIGAEVGFAEVRDTTVQSGWTPPADRLVGRREVQFTVLHPASVKAQVMANLGVTPNDAGDVLRFTLTMPDRERARVALDAIMDRTIVAAADLKAARLREQHALLNEQFEHQDSLLNADDARLHAYLLETITQPTDPGAPIASSSVTQSGIQANYFAEKLQLDALRADSVAIRQVLGNPSLSPTELMTRLESIGAVNSNSALKQLLSTLLQEEATRRTLLTTYTEINPLVVEKDSIIDQLRTHSIPVLTEQLLAQLRLEERQLQSNVASQERELRQIPSRVMTENALRRKRDVTQSIHRDLQVRVEAALMAARTAAVPDMSILGKASVSSSPLQDPSKEILLMAIAAGLGLGILGAVMRERLDPRLRYPSEVTMGMGLHILGAIPALRRGRIGTSDMALAVEAFRAIQLSLTHAHGNGLGLPNGNGHGPMMVTFSSPGASDGKSFVTSNLAIAFADMGYRTLVVDGDVRRGTLHQLLGTTHKPGLTDYLSGKVTRAEIVRSTRYPLLDIIGCGSRGEQGPKLLGSPAMSRLFQDLKSDYDVILVDSPPLGACVDPMILGTLTKNLVLVLRTGTTDRTMAESKLDVLDRLPVRVLGAILNDVSSHGPYRYYSYISGYEILDDVEPGAEIKQLPAE